MNYILLILVVLINSCSGNLTMPVNITGNEIGRVGDESGSTRTITNTQTSIAQKWDNVKNTEVQITQEMKDSYKKGLEDAKKFMANYTPAKTISLGETEFYKKNKRIKGCRHEIRWTMERSWEAGSRFLAVNCHRSAADQAKHYASGASQVKVGPHNANPSNAIDVVPVEEKTNRLMWGDDRKTQRKDLNEYHYQQGINKGIFLAGVAIFGWKLEYRAGIDWKQKGNTYQKTTLYDLAHWEVVKKCYGGNCQKTLKI